MNTINKLALAAAATAALGAAATSDRLRRKQR